MPFTEIKAGFEEVFTVTDYYDGPRQGIANYQGQPHFYDCIFGGLKQDYSNLYRLTPVSQELLVLALEDWGIWKRWERAFYTGAVDRDSHPALPAERDRHLQIHQLLDGRLKTDIERCIVRTGVFAKATSAAPAPGILVDLLVRWSEPTGNSDSIWAD